MFLEQKPSHTFSYKRKGWDYRSSGLMTWMKAGEGVFLSSGIWDLKCLMWNLEVQSMWVWEVSCLWKRLTKLFPSTAWGPVFIKFLVQERREAENSLAIRNWVKHKQPEIIDFNYYELKLKDLVLNWHP